MLRRRSRYTLMLLVLLLPTHLLADNWMCGHDMDADGSVDALGETQACDLSSGSPFCQLGAVACTPDAACSSAPPTTITIKAGTAGITNFVVQYDLKDGSAMVLSGNGPSINVEIPIVNMADVCSTPTTASTTLKTIANWVGAPFSGTNSAGMGFLHSEPTCDNNLVGLIGIVHIDDCGVTSCDPFSTHMAMQVEYDMVSCVPSPPTCPLGEFACVNISGTPMCAAKTCTNLEVTPPVTSDIPTTMFQDDGPKTTDGACLGTAMLFTGRPMRCDLAGASNSWSSCCKPTDKIFHDDAGGSSSPVSAISGAFAMITKANAEFANALTLGLPVMDAATRAATAVSDFAEEKNIPLDMIAFNRLLLESLIQGCDQNSMETSMLASSGMCHEVGSFCRKKWPLIGCVQKAKSYCCFNTKMGRIIHEQGRPQLTGFTPSPWGNAEAPQCRGLTPTEFQNLDFSKIDFKDYFGDLIPDTAVQIKERVNEGVERFFAPK